MSFAQDGDQITGTVVDDGGAGECPGIYVGKVTMIVTQTSESIYEGASTGGTDLDTCTIDPALVVDLRIVVDGGSAEYTSEFDGQATPPTTMTRLD